MDQNIDGGKRVTNTDKMAAESYQRSLVARPICGRSRRLGSWFDPVCGGTKAKSGRNLLLGGWKSRLCLKKLLIRHSVGARAMVMLVGTQGVAGARSHNSIDGPSIVTGSGESLLQAHHVRFGARV